MTASAVFLDRDGVINRKPDEGEYVLSPDRLVLLPGVTQALSLLATSTTPIFVITNQRGVARGLLSIEELNRIHERLRYKLARAGIQVAGVYTCPHDYDACDCRKPAPGLLFQAQREFPHVDLSTSYVIGDSASDVEAGYRAGCRTILVGRGRRANQQAAQLKASSIVPTARHSTLLKAVRHVILADADREPGSAPGATRTTHPFLRGSFSS